MVVRFSLMFRMAELLPLLERYRFPLLLPHRRTIFAGFQYIQHEFHTQQLELERKSV